MYYITETVTQIFSVSSIRAHSKCETAIAYPVISLRLYYYTPTFFYFASEISFPWVSLYRGMQLISTSSSNDFSTVWRIDGKREKLMARAKVINPVVKQNKTKKNWNRPAVNHANGSHITWAKMEAAERVTSWLLEQKLPIFERQKKNNKTGELINRSQKSNMSIVDVRYTHHSSRFSLFQVR